MLIKTVVTADHLNSSEPGISQQTVIALQDRLATTLPQKAKAGLSRVDASP